MKIIVSKFLISPDLEAQGNTLPTPALNRFFVVTLYD